MLNCVKNLTLLRWQTQSYSPLQRQLSVMKVALQLGTLLGWDRLFGEDSPKQRDKRAKWLVNQLIILGPTFIKIGQALSTRPDLLPLEYVQELGQLQDRVPQFNSDTAISIIEQELQQPISQLFERFDRTPLASASLGQVHYARLYTGEEVVVKVQRPGLERLFRVDFAVLERLVHWGNRYISGMKKYELTAIYQEFFELLYQEIDYIHEGKNAERFRDNFRSIPRVKIPRVYWRYTSKKVLTLEYLPGIKIDDTKTIEDLHINKDKIIELGICSYLKQLLLDGFFQSDPHPGNMAVTKKGELIFYDFGTMAEVQSIAKDQMIRTFFAVLRKDTDEVVETLTYMGLIEPMSDMTPVKRLIAFLLDKFRDKPIDIRAFEQLGGELYIMFEKQPFRLPPQMTFIIKSLTTLDGIARALDPAYNLLAAAQPFIRSLTLSPTPSQGVLGSVVQQTREFIKYRLNQPSRTELAIQHLEEKLELGELQLRVKSLESDRILKRIHLTLKCLLYTVLSGFSGLGLLLSVMMGYSGGIVASFCLMVFWGIFLVRSIVKLFIRERLDQLADKT